jgi:hypothetical protein
MEKKFLSHELIKKVPDPEDRDAFETLERIVNNFPQMDDGWINVFLTRFHCKGLSYYLSKYGVQ